MSKAKIDQIGLTERQRKALPFFVASASDSEACRQANVAKQTYYEWLKEPVFKAELHQLRDIVVQNAVEVLKNHTTKAVDTLVRLLDTSNPSLQRNVANDILQHVAKFKELRKLEERLEMLEQKIKK